MGFQINDNLIYANARLKVGDTAGGSMNGLQTFNTDELDTADGWNGTDTYTVPADGEYDIKYSIRGTANSVAQRIEINSVIKLSGRVNDASADNGFISGLLILSKGDTIQCVNVGSGTNNGNVNENFLIIERRADYSAGSVAGFNLATESEYGLVKQNKWQRRPLTVSISDTASNIASFRMDNLVEGRRYRITAQATIQITGNTGTQFTRLRGYYDGTEITYNMFRSDENATNNKQITTRSEAIITATAATQVTFDCQVTGVGSILGAVSTPLSYTEIEELGDVTDETTDFTP